MKFWYKSLTRYVNIDPENLQSTRTYEGEHCFIQIVDGHIHNSFDDNEIWVTDTYGAKPRPATKEDLARFKEDIA